MKHTLRVSSTFLKLLNRSLYTSQNLCSTAFRENLDSYVILTKNRSSSRNWPEQKLGPIEAINPKYPLPGHVGLVENFKKREVKLIPATNNLPIPSTQHYVSVLSQADYTIEESEDSLSLMPQLDPSLEHSVQSCPELIKSDLSALYPTKDFSGTRLVSILFHYSLKKPEDAENFDDVYESFVQSALDVCASLTQMGYWADFMHPKTGVPYIGFHLYPNIEGRLTNYGFNVNSNGCCKVNRERLQNERLFVGIVFTDAPKDHPVIHFMHNPSSVNRLFSVLNYIYLLRPTLWTLGIYFLVLKPEYSADVLSESLLNNLI